MNELYSFELFIYIRLFIEGSNLGLFTFLYGYFIEQL